MALVASDVSAEPRSFSIGPWKIQMKTFTVASADVSGTITCASLKEIIFVQVNGVALTSAPTFSGSVITLAFADPAATRVGSIVAYGR